MKRRHRLWYQIAFSWVNFADALVYLFTLGYVSPGWPMMFCAWYALRHHTIRRIPAKEEPR